MGIKQEKKEQPKRRSLLGLRKMIVLGLFGISGFISYTNYKKVTELPGSIFEESETETLKNTKSLIKLTLVLIVLRIIAGYTFKINMISGIIHVTILMSLNNASVFSTLRRLFGPQTTFNSIITKLLYFDLVTIVLGSIFTIIPLSSILFYLIISGFLISQFGIQLPNF